VFEKVSKQLYDSDERYRKILEAIKNKRSKRESK
jgi:hypothetical protein